MSVLLSVVTTIRHHEAMQNSSLHLLLTNLCFSNLLTSFLVKPISAIYSGYSLSVGTWRVGTSASKSSIRRFATNLRMELLKH